MSSFNESGHSDFSSSNYAYGSTGATGKLDVKQFLTKPQVICRIVTLLFAVVVAGCIGSQGWENGICKFYSSSSTCNYGVFLGLLTCVVSAGFIALDFLFDNMSNILHRKYVVISDILISGLTTFLWFSCFCDLADKRRKTTETDFDSWGGGKAAMEVTIAFAFFSIVTFGILTGLAIKRYKEGVSQGMDQSPYIPDPFNNPDGFSP